MSGLLRRRIRPRHGVSVGTMIIREISLRRLTNLTALVVYLLISSTCTDIAVTNETHSPSTISQSEPPLSVPRLTGAHTRVVWTQDAGDGADYNSGRPQQTLMGFDNGDGRGERSILGTISNYAKPLITPGGDRVVFSNRQDQSIYVVDWEGTGLRRLTDGFALEVWQDPATGVEWVYSGLDEANTRAMSYHTIRRHRLDETSDGEFVWDKAPVSEDNFQLSFDGRHTSGLFPWPHVGLADLTNHEWTKLGEGCWTALAPHGPELAWYFDGSHRNLTLVELTSDARWQVPINGAPGIDGYEVYHPRWSNHPRFLTMTGPYTMGCTSARCGDGSVEIYLGQFAPDYRTVSSWTRVTTNERADFYPDAWIDPHERNNLIQSGDGHSPTRMSGAIRTVDSAVTNFPTRVVLEATTLEDVPLPNPDAIAPYRQALLAIEYQVDHVIEGDYSLDTVLVAHWIIRDGEMLPTAAHPKGKHYRLTLELYDEHPELEGQRLVMDADDVLLPLYYDTNSLP